MHSVQQCEPVTSLSFIPRKIRSPKRLNRLPNRARLAAPHCPPHFPWDHVCRSPQPGHHSSGNSLSAPDVSPSEMSKSGIGAISAQRFSLMREVGYQQGCPKSARAGQNSAITVLDGRRKIKRSSAHGRFPRSSVPLPSRARALSLSFVSLVLYYHVLGWIDCSHPLRSSSSGSGQQVLAAVAHGAGAPELTPSLRRPRISQ